MVYDILHGFLKNDAIRDKIIVFSDKSIVTGGSVIEINRSYIKFYGGESSYEEFEVPLENIVEIRKNEKVIFRKKKRIQKIYPRS